MTRRTSPALKADQAAQALMKTLNVHAAGIDIGAAEHWVCVPEGSVPEQARPGQLPCHVRRFGACTADLRSLIAFLREAKVDTVAMESMGIYWVPLFDLLEAEGFRVLGHQKGSLPT